MAKIFITQHFCNQAKRLKKRFPHLKEDLILTLRDFNPQNEIHIGRSIFKIRIKSRDLQKGKSGGLRSYIYLYKNRDLLTPICIYSKSDQENLSSNALDYHFTEILNELIKTFS